MALSASLLQHQFIRIRENRLFEAAVIAVIVISALAVGAKTYPIDPQYRTVLEGLDLAVTLFFLTEILIRMAAERRLRDFFRQGWNVFDFIIVTASLVPLQDADIALVARLLRIFRVLRLVSIIPELRVLISALLISIPRMGYVALLMFIIFYIYGAVGSFLFGGINEDLWGNISIAMLTLFRIATFEDWTDVMYETMSVYPLSWVFYVTFIFLAAFVFLNMMIGIILDVMQREHERHSRESGEGEAGEVHWIREHTESMEGRLARIESLLEAQTGEVHRRGPQVPGRGEG